MQKEENLFDYQKQKKIVVAGKLENVNVASVVFLKLISF